MSGKLIVFEGTDGSGKATQSTLLFQRLQQEGFPAKKIDFPRYGKPSAAMVEEYLHGNLGKRPEDVNAYAASMFYAMDRYASYRQDWGEFYKSGGIIIADRYTTSNAVHQASKLAQDARAEYLEWLFDLEYHLLELPRPDLVFYLNMPVEITQKMMRKREQETGTTADIHEQDAEYLKKCQENALDVAVKCGWKMISCEAGGQPKKIETIQQEVWKAAKELL